MSEKDYDIGYGKPPVANQFKPGQSGNYNGKPIGSKSLSTLVWEEGNRIIKVRIGAKSKRMTKRAALARQLYDMAMMEKNIHATKVILGQEAAAAALAASQAEQLPAGKIRFTLKLEEDAPGPDLPPF